MSASTGNMNSEIAAPTPISSPRSPTWNEYVANSCVWLAGPPPVSA